MHSGRDVAKRNSPSFAAHSGRTGSPWVTAVVIAIVTSVASYFLYTHLGFEQFVLALAGVTIAVLFAIASMKNTMVPFAMWITAVLGFGYLWSVQSPVLPDLYVDRMILIWVSLIFVVKLVVEKQPLKGPFALDVLILLHGLYIYIRVVVQDSVSLQPWFVSVATPYAAYFLAKNIVTDEKRIRWLWWTLLALMVYYSFTAIVEKYRIDSLIFPKSILAAKELEFRGRSIGPFAQPAVFGTVIGMIIPIHLYFIVTLRSVVGRIVVAIGLLASLVGLYFTYTRGSWLAGVAGLACAVLLNRKSYLRIMTPILIVACILGLVVVGVGSDEFMKERVENDNTLGSRVGTAVTVLRVWRDHPLFGVGFFQFRRVRDTYIEPVEAPWLGTIRFNQFRTCPIHDIYLGPLAEDGLVGAALQFGIYLILLRTFLSEFRRRRSEDHYATFILPIFASTFVAYLVGGIAFDYRYFSSMGTLFYMTAGIMAGYRRPEPGNVPL